MVCLLKKKKKEKITIKNRNYFYYPTLYILFLQKLTIYNVKHEHCHKILNNKKNIMLMWEIFEINTFFLFIL